jgi:hypothetical protein
LTRRWPTSTRRGWRWPTNASGCTSLARPR